MSEAQVIDVQVDEARRLAMLQMEINRKFEGKDKDFGLWMQLKDELRVKAAELGFVVDIELKTDDAGNWFPICNIVGRSDPHLAEILNTEGPDIERKAYDAKRTSSAELIEEGIDINLIG